MIQTSICTEKDFHTDWYQRWMYEMKEGPRLHRKQWEFAVIAQALFERGMMEPGKRGLGFGVGTEPLPALFVKYGCEVMVTDLDPEREDAKKWKTGNQLLEKVSSLNDRHIADDKLFKKNVQYRSVDMNNIPADLHGYDFTWSACSMDHLGTLDKTKEFMLKQMDCLQEGGWAVHTSEFNVSSNNDTMTHGDVVIFRKKDIIELAKKLESHGYDVEDINFSTGSSKIDKLVDEYPYKEAPHLKLKLFEYTVTSFVIIVRKGKITHDRSTLSRLRNRWSRLGI